MITPFTRSEGRAAALLASVALAGCSTMAPRYERPSAPVAATFAGAEAYGEAHDAAAPPVADIGWRQVFSDPLLHRLIERTLINNRDLRVANLNVEAARARYRIDRAANLPTVSLGADATVQRLPSDLFYNRRQYQVGGTVTAWELDLWGRTRSLSEQALQSFFAAEETRNAAHISLIGELATSYLTLRADQAMLKLSRDTLEAQKRSYELTRQLADVGYVTELDVRRAETALRSAQSDVAAYTRQSALDRNALVLLLGEPITPELAGELDALDTLPDGIVLADLPAGLPSDLLTRRPDIRAAEHTLRAANANIGAARAAFFPTVSLTGSGGTASASLENLFSGGSEAWVFAPRITLPIFQGGALRANLDRSEVQKSTEVANYEKAIQIAFREVSDGLAAKETFEDQLQVEQQRVSATAAAFQLADQRFREGEDDSLAVLDAQRAHYAAQQALVRVRLARLSNLVHLYKALGGGWSAETTSTASTS